MPMGLVKNERDEHLWSKAKSQAAKQGHTEDWAYINGIYQRMKGHKKSASLLEPLIKRANVDSAEKVRKAQQEKQYPGITQAHYNMLKSRYDEGHRDFWHVPPRIQSALSKATLDRPDLVVGVRRVPTGLMLYNARLNRYQSGDQLWMNPKRKMSILALSKPTGITKRSSLLASLEKSARVLSTRGRKQVAEKNFAMPASAAKSGTGQKGSYPIHDLPHARSALTYGKRFLSADEYDKLKARVYAKYPSLKKGNDMSKRGSLLDSLFKTAGKVPGVPDATGPYGRGAGPGKGTKSGLGLVMAKMERGEELTEEEKAILETAKGKIKK